MLPQRASGVRMTVLKEPVGPVAAFAPWNFPIGNPARKIGAALGAGCPCILKPAEEAPASALEVARALVDAGLPPGVLSVVFGVPSGVSRPTCWPRRSSARSRSPVRSRWASSSTKLAADGMKRTTMELGGHAPVLVFDDVDVEHVLDLSVFAKYRNAGQVCVSPTRFYVHEKIYDRFVEGFAARAGALRVGDGLDEAHADGSAGARASTGSDGRIADAMRASTAPSLHTGGSRLPAHGLLLGADRAVGRCRTTRAS